MGYDSCTRGPSGGNNIHDLPRKAFTVSGWPKFALTMLLHIYHIDTSYARKEEFGLGAG
jgi:hypothetical protein